MAGEEKGKERLDRLSELREEREIGERTYMRGRGRGRIRQRGRERCRGEGGRHAREGGRRGCSTERGREKGTKEREVRMAYFMLGTTNIMQKNKE